MDMHAYVFVNEKSQVLAAKSIRLLVFLVEC